MMTFFLQIISIISTLLLLLGCSELESKKNNINTYRIPWSNGSGKLSFQDVVIDDLNSPYKMSGSSAKVILNGNYNKSSGPQGAVAQPNFIRSGKVLVPADVESIAAVTAYAHMNRLHKLDKDLGVKSFLKWPRVIGVNMLVSTSNGGAGNDSAFHSLVNNTINILPYSKSGKPMYVNGNVLAHEHFHALYYSKTKWHSMHKQSEMENRLTKADHISICEKTGFYSEVAVSLLNKKEVGLSSAERLKINRKSLKKLIHQTNYVIARAWSEGSADFYSYLYDRNLNFVADSLPGGSDYRKLDGRYIYKFRDTSEIILNLRVLNNIRCDETMTSVKEYQESGVSSETVYFYRIASDYVKFLKRLIDASIMKKKYGQNSQKKIVEAMIATLMEMNVYLQANYLKTFMSPLKPIDLILEKLNVIDDPEVCGMVEELSGSSYCGKTEEEK